jgi:hypothetical protein
MQHTCTSAEAEHWAVTSQQEPPPAQGWPICKQDPPEEPAPGEPPVVEALPLPPLDVPLPPGLEALPAALDAADPLVTPEAPEREVELLWPASGSSPMARTQQPGAAASAEATSPRHSQRQCFEMPTRERLAARGSLSIECGALASMERSGRGRQE